MAMDWWPTSSTAADQQNERRAIVWSLLYVVVFIAVTLAIRTGSLGNDFLAIMAISVAGLVGLGWIRAYRRWLNGLDELRRKVELEALAFAIGAGFVGAIALGHLALAEIISDARFERIFLVMFFAYAAGRVFGYWRYR